MRKLQEISGPSCLTNAADDEPLFVLRANDELAPQIVREWAYHYRLKHETADTLTPTRAAKLAEAWQLATDMERWRIEKHNAAPTDAKRVKP